MLRLSVAFWQKQKKHSPEQGETISNARAHVNDQIGRNRQRESEAQASPNGNLYIQLRLVSHKLADPLIQFQ
jgi:hypothetical protein